MKLENFTDLQNWGTEQWGDAELGDSRRTERAMSTTGYSAIAANQQRSIPEIMSGWNELRAAYRLMNEEDVTHSALKKIRTQASQLVNCLIRSLITSKKIFTQNSIYQNSEFISLLMTQEFISRERYGELAK